MTVLLAGLILGVVGSGHCAVMCGPLLALVTPWTREARVSALGLIGQAALHHLGRTLTYVALGALLGTVGGWLTTVGFGRGLAVVSGALLVGQACAGHHRIARRFKAPHAGAWVTRQVARAIGWMRTHRLGGPLLFGALNGLLPCGLVYAALTAAAGLGDAVLSLTFMAGFAAGTTPVLAACAGAGRAVGGVVSPRLRRLAPVAMAVVGMLLIVRGVAAPGAGHASHGAAASHTSHQH